MVLSITVIFLGFTLALPGANKQKLDVAASTVAEDIRLVQQLNMNQDAVYTVLFDCQNDIYYIQRGLSLYKKVQLPYGVDLVLTNFDFDNYSDNGCDHKLRFNIRGEPVRNNGILCGGHLSLRDKNGNFRYVIVASVTGRVRTDKVPPA
ncbi:hypothetical protein Pmgp_03012 [Pelotomaculum propionicicum]|uniref:General secretion pathway GspH domain-containing protein n=1 Tax=Pelotomaculum propionicicum TaxID=258475 RepID=A0A4Y7RLA3_9FIRM|nr:hypothetical protein Pmgp_03012 [Pelotomaculum propionicicum]